MDWITLRDFCSIVNSKPTYRFLNLDNALKNAMISGEVPVRGKADFEFEFQRIEKRLGFNPQIATFLNQVDTVLIEPNGRRILTTFRDVQVDRMKIERWLDNNAAEYPSVVRAEEEETVSHKTVRAERMFERWLVDQEEHPIRTKGEVWDARCSPDILGKLGERLSQKAFNRAWTNKAPTCWTRGGRRPLRQ
jgi:hypothetical protein